MALLFQALLLLPLVAVLAQERERYCSKPDRKATELKFTKPPSTLQIACYGEYFELHCCLQGFMNISWYQYDPDEKRWRDFHEYHPSSDRYLENGEQALVIQSADGARDQGEYSCVATAAAGNPLVHNVSLDVYSCVHWDRKPVAMFPSDNITVELLPGEAFNYTCQGFFGVITKSCTGLFCRAYWGYTDTEKIFKTQFPSKNSSARIWASEQIISPESQGTQLETTLHIREVREEDYSLQFWCRLTNRPGQTAHFITLAKPSDEGEWPGWKLYVMVAGMLLGVGIVLAVGKRYHLDIRLIYKDKFKRHSGYQLVLLGADRDQGFTHSLYRQLSTNRHCQTYLCSDTQTEHCEELSCSLRAAQENGRTIAFVLSDSFLCNTECINKLNETVQEGYNNIVFIILDPATTAERNMEQKRVPWATSNIIRAGRQVSWPPAVRVEDADFKWSSRQAAAFLQNLNTQIKLLKYHLVLLYASENDQDRDFARQLHEYLEDTHKYRVFIADGAVEPSERPIDVYDQAKQNGHLMACILSPGFFADQGCMFCLDHAVLEEYRNMVFILLQPLTPAFLEAQRLQAATRRAIQVGRKLHWPLSGSGLQRFLEQPQVNERDEHEMEDGPEIDVRRYEKWNQGKVKAFVKRLRLEMPSLPSSHKQEEQQVHQPTPVANGAPPAAAAVPAANPPRDSNSSHCPLLHSVGEEEEQPHTIFTHPEEEEAEVFEAESAPRARVNISIEQGAGDSLGDSGMYSPGPSTEAFLPICSSQNTE